MTPQIGPRPAAFRAAIAKRANAFRDHIESAAATRSASMRAGAARTRNGTRWLPTLAVLVPATVLSGFLADSVLQGALAANFNVSNTPLELRLDDVRGQGLSAIMAQTDMKQADGSTTQVGVLHIGIDEATIGNLCAVITQNIAGLEYSVVLKTPVQGVTAKNLIADVTHFDGQTIRIDGSANIGRSVDEIVAAGGQSLGGQPGGFGLDARDAKIALGTGTGVGRSAQLFGQLAIPGLSLELVNGKPAACG